MRKRALVFLFVLFALVLVACHRKPPKAGDPCKKEGDFVCASETKRMVCTKGQYVAETCLSCVQKKGFGTSESGYSGCIAGGIGPEGSPCPADDSVDCDGNVLVKCVEGQYRHFSCGGANGCRRTPSDVLCDAAIAVAGEACRREKDGACSADQKSRLHCRSGKFVADDTCKGPKGCTVQPAGEHTFDLNCDESAGDVGDPCSPDGSGTCSTDKSSLLVCRNGKYASGQKCHGSNPTCGLISADTIRCAETGIAEVGEFCPEEGSGACGIDGKGFLKCVKGAFVQTETCKACRISGTKVTCKH